MEGFRVTRSEAVERLNLLATVVMAVAALVVAVTVVATRTSSNLPGSSAYSDRTLAAADWSALLAGGVKTGSPDASANLVVFADFECPVCGGFAREVLPRLQERFGSGLAVTFRHWPLTYHPMARPAAIAAECAAQQGAFWEFHDRLFAVQAELARVSLDSIAFLSGVADSAAFVRCRSSETPGIVVDRDAALAQQIGAPGTPTLVLNGVLLGTGGSEAPLMEAISKEVERLAAQ